MSNTFQIPLIGSPNNEEKFLLHSCCAPCSTAMIEACLNSNIRPTIFFYNPNIHPKAEYELRKQENMRFAKIHGLDFIDADYDVEVWKEKVKGFEKEPERGARCQLCFDLRLNVTAQYASENGFALFTTTLASSRWKSLEQIFKAGQNSASLFEGVSFWEQDWRKRGLSNRKEELTKKHDFYRQEYCGCSYSLRDSNIWRKENGRKQIKIATKE